LTGFDFHPATNIMLRSALFLAGLALVSADSKIGCTLNGARAVDDLLDAATYIWASVQRCNYNTTNPQRSTTLCAMDVSSAIEAVNAMVNVVLKAVEECGDLEGEHVQCGLAVGVLTKSMAGVAAGSSGVDAKCRTNPMGYLIRNQGPRFGNVNGALANAANTNSAGANASNFGQCVVNVKDLTKNIFKASKRIVTVKDNCDGEHSRHCAHNALKIVASFAAIGEYLSGAIGRCSAMTANTSKMIGDSQCAAEVLDLVGAVNRMASAGIEMKRKCAEGEERLYQLEHGEGVEQGSSSSMTMALAALLPLTAVVAFVGGSRFAKGRQTHNFEMIQE
jgi:hypothetical protein